MNKKQSSNNSFKKQQKHKRHFQCKLLITRLFFFLSSNTWNYCEPLTQKSEILLDFTPLMLKCSQCVYWPRRWCSSGLALPSSSAWAPFPCRLTPKLPSPTDTALMSAGDSTWGGETWFQKGNIWHKNILKYKVIGLTWSSRTAYDQTLWCCVPCSRRGAPWEP